MIFLHSYGVGTSRGKLASQYTRDISAASAVGSSEKGKDHAPVPRLWEIIRDWWMRHPARLVLWHLPPCWPIVLISVAAPIILSSGSTRSSWRPA
ncbi:MAG: hypothetical protein ACXW25_09355 [Rhodospirillales bacterium]